MKTSTMSVLVDGALNGTGLTLGGLVGLDRHRYLYFLLLLTVSIFVLFSDSVVIYLICSQKSLHKPMYVFIAALLFNSLAGSATICPKLLADFLSEHWVVSLPACLGQAFVIQFLGGSGFMLLSVMAYDRYISICRPLQYPSIITAAAVRALLLLAWLLPAAQVAGATLLAARLQLCTFRLNGLYCDIYSIARNSCESIVLNNVYGFLCTTTTVFLPIIFIVFSYVRILVVCLQRSQALTGKALQTCLPHLLVFLNYSSSVTFHLVHSRLQANDTVSSSIASLLVFVLPTLFNPILYGLKMQEISKRLKKLFCYQRTK